MITNIKSNTGLSSFYIIFKGAALIETVGNRGLSHICEHLMCKSFQHKLDEYEILGINWNAFTSGEELVFHMSGLDEEICQVRSEFLDLILNDSVRTEEEFQTEREIIREEYKDSFRNPSYAHIMNFYRKMLNHYSPIGSWSDITTVTYKDYLDMMSKHYTTPWRIVSVSNTPFESNINFIGSEYESRFVPQEWRSNGYSLVEIDRPTFYEQSSIIFSFDSIQSDFAICQFINEMLCGNLNAPITRILREEHQLTYHVQNGMVKLHNTAYNMFEMSTSHDKVSQSVELMLGILKDPEKHLSEHRFNICKKATQINIRQQEILNHEWALIETLPHEWNIRKQIESLTIDKVREVYEKHFNWIICGISVDSKHFVGDDEELTNVSINAELN